MLRKMRRIVLWVCAVPAALLILRFVGLFRIEYLHPVENIPFDHPVKVISVDDHAIQLSDGRTLLPEAGVDDFLRNAIHESENLIGLEFQENGIVSIFGRRRRTICGLGSPLLILPVIPMDIPRWRRIDLLTRGQLKESP